jgi:7-carboxy-7-deazaguanine synthase
VVINIRGEEKYNIMKLVVNEIFYSIQGESTYAGMPCTFIRLAYCNLRCSYCDTAYAFDEGKEMQLDEVMDIVRVYGCKLVEITGGEPLLQPSVHPLMKILCDEGYEVLLETGGSIDISSVDPRVKRIVDFKSPSSGMELKNNWDNIHYLKQDDEVKFVIGNKADYDWAEQVIKKYDLSNRLIVLMSPVFGEIDLKLLTEWILSDKLNVRLQLQLQKYIWNPDKRGV